VGRRGQDGVLRLISIQLFRDALGGLALLVV
jgi:hypothetical protein